MFWGCFVFDFVGFGFLLLTPPLKCVQAPSAEPPMRRTLSPLQERVSQREARQAGESQATEPADACVDPLTPPPGNLELELEQRSQGLALLHI